jgi:hypothetical protein
VGKGYNYIGLAGHLVEFKAPNAGQFNLERYYCSQLVAAAYSYAGARLHSFSLDLAPGELADLANSKLTAIGALYDKGYHQWVREGREVVNLDVTDREQKFVEGSFRERFGGTTASG